MKTRIGSRQRGKRERGQSLVEFALSISLLMWILSGVLDIGRMYMTYLALQSAAGEGAMFACIHPTWVDSCPVAAIGCRNPAYDSIIARTRNEAPLGGLVDWTTADISVITGPGGTLQTMPITVTITYEYEMFTPMISAIWPTVDLSGTAMELILDPGH